MVAQLDAMIAGTDRLTADEAGRAARGDLHQARPEPVPAHHPRRAAAPRRRRRSPPRRSWTGSTCCALATRTCPPRTSRWATSSCCEVERGWRDMKTDPGPAPGLPPARRPHPRPRPALLARAAPGPDRRDHHRRHLAPRSARTCSDCTSAPSPAPPAPSASAPSSPPPNATSSPSSASTHPRRSSNSGRHRQRPDQHEHHRLDTRPSRRLPAFPQVKPQIPCPAPTSAAEPGSEEPRSRLGESNPRPTHYECVVPRPHRAHRVHPCTSESTRCSPSPTVGLHLRPRRRPRQRSTEAGHAGQPACTMQQPILAPALGRPSNASCVRRVDVRGCARMGAPGRAQRQAGRSARRLDPDRRPE